MPENFFDNLRKKIDRLENEKDKNKMRELVINIMVDIEKFCHRPDVDIHRVLADTRERCKKEINKPYNN